MAEIPRQVKLIGVALTAVVLFLLAQVALGLADAGEGALVTAAWSLLVLVVLGGFAAWRSGAVTGMVTHRVLVQGDDWADAARHEAGHAATAKGIDAWGIKGKIRRDGTGYVQYQCSSYTSEAEIIAVSLAGGMREGVDPFTAPQCRGDLANVNRELRGISKSRHHKVISRARGIARAHIHSGYASRVESKLLRNGSF